MPNRDSLQVPSYEVTEGHYHIPKKYRLPLEGADLRMVMYGPAERPWSIWHMANLWMCCLSRKVILQCQVTRWSAQDEFGHVHCPLRVQLLIVCLFVLFCLGLRCDLEQSPQIIVSDHCEQAQ